jgi:alpha-soluble NSF attachment protein
MDKFVQAANSFKLAKDWKNCAKASVRCADMATMLGTKHEAANFYVQAGDSMKRIDLVVAVGHYRSAADLYCEIGRFATAAKQLESVGETFESEGNLEEAIKCFKQAADFYQGENASAKASKCLEKVALHAATLGRYDVGAKIFEELGTKSLESTLLTFNAKKHFMRAGICLLARGDTIAASQGNVRFGQMDYTFADSREGKLLKDLVEACDASDPDLFTQKLYTYDQVSKLNPWETTLLLRVKGVLSGGAAAGGGGKEDDDGEPDVR